MRVHPTRQFNASVDLRAIAHYENVRKTAAPAAISSMQTAVERASVPPHHAWSVHASCAGCSACMAFVAMQMDAKFVNAMTRHSLARN